MADVETVQQVTTWLGLLDKHFSAISVLAGGFLGGVLVYFREKLLKKKDFELRYFDKVLERRILAHEKILPVVTDINVTVMARQYTGEESFDTVPVFLLSKYNFNDWCFRFQQARKQTSQWLTTSVKNELEFLQNYIVNLQPILDLIEEEEDVEFNLKTFMIGRELKDELRSIAISIEDKINLFFEKGTKDGISLKTGNITISEEQMLAKLNNTQLIKKMTTFKEIANSRESL
ncbi:MAG: hypothetical protein AB7E96_07020 [Deferribacterales bacterium]